MHAEIFRAFDAICRSERAGGDVLEIGASPDADTLLRLPALAGAASRTGIDLDGTFADASIRILAGSANAMPQFADRSFDTVLCNSVLEHDARFWMTLAEIRRVARPSALIAIGVPGFGEQGEMPLAGLASALKRLPGGRRIASILRASTATLGRHDFPSDYYRFSRQAVGGVLLEGCDNVRTRVLLAPPRIIGWGRRSAAPR